jgi:4-hydroxy-tetrahydrodipicolinate reductase
MGPSWTRTFRSERIRVIHYGLGPIGVGVAKLITARKDMQIVGAIDIDPHKVGKDFGDLLGAERKLGVTISNDAPVVLDKNKADIVVLTTASSLSGITSQLKQIAVTGLPVISTCEELSARRRTTPISSRNWTRLPSSTASRSMERV